MYLLAHVCTHTIHICRCNFRQIQYQNRIGLLLIVSLDEKTSDCGWIIESADNITSTNTNNFTSTINIIVPQHYMHSHVC